VVIVSMKPHIRASSTAETRVAKPKTSMWEMRLYVAGETRNSISAISNLKRLCEKHLPGGYRIKIIDLVKHPELAMRDQIVAVPTLIRNLPHPIRKMMGNLSGAEKAFQSHEICQVEQD
jgi:circadian clock protein KaiB